MIREGAGAELILEQLQKRQELKEAPYHPLAVDADEVDHLGLPGHPWRRIIGMASGFSEKSAAKCRLISSTGVVNWGKLLARVSHVLLYGSAQPDPCRYTY